MIDMNSSQQMLTTAPGLFELPERVDALNQKWMKELTLRHGPDVRFSSLSTLFEKGIQSLQEFYRGTLLRTFKDIFALMHIVHACAWIYHEKDEPNFLHAFFLDIFQWHYAIATDEDKRLFLDVASQLWSVPEYSLAEAASMTASWGMLDLFGLHNALSGGQVISLCTRYLEGKLLLSIVLICLELKIYRFRICKDL